MSSFLERLFWYFEKVLSPYQVWMATFIISGTILFIPNDWKSHLDIIEIYNNYKGYISIIFLGSGIVLLIKGVDSIFIQLKEYKRIDAKNLTDEEKAVLCFFVSNQYQGASLDETHPAIISLRRRNFILTPPSPITIIGGDNYEYFILTRNGEKKLRSKSFRARIFDGMNQNNILLFINSISKREYSLHNPKNFR